MTNKEAAKWLRTFQYNTGMQELAEAFQVAIKALESNIVHCKDCKKHRTKYCAMNKHNKDVTIYNANPDDFCSKGVKK